MAGEIITDDIWQKPPNIQRWFDLLSQRAHARTVSQTIQQVGKMWLAGELIPITRKTSLAKGTEIIGSGTTGLPYLNTD